MFFGGARAVSSVGAGVCPSMWSVWWSSIDRGDGPRGRPKLNSRRSRRSRSSRSRGGPGREEQPAGAGRRRRRRRMSARVVVIELHDRRRMSQVEPKKESLPGAQLWSTDGRREISHPGRGLATLSARFANLVCQSICVSQSVSQSHMYGTKRIFHDMRSGSEDEHRHDNVSRYERSEGSTSSVMVLSVSGVGQPLMNHIHWIGAGHCCKHVFRQPEPTFDQHLIFCWYVSDQWPIAPTVWF